MMYRAGRLNPSVMTASPVVMGCEPVACLPQSTGSCGAEDGPAHAAAHLQLRIRGVHDGVHRHSGDVAANNIQSHDVILPACAVLRNRQA